MEQLKPWTAIIPLNEEFYITLQERLKNIRLPIVRLRSRKVQQEGHPTLLPSKPWERYTSQETVQLYIGYDETESSHKDFDFQVQAERDRKERKLKAVFIDSVTLSVPYEVGVSERTHYEVDFNCCRVPKSCETRRLIREEIRSLKDNRGLYPDISRKDVAYYQHIFENPSCLEIRQVRQIANPLPPKNKNPQDMLDGLSEQSQNFLKSLMWTTKNLVWDVFKRYDTHSGYILDGRIPENLLPLTTR